MLSFRSSLQSLEEGSEPPKIKKQFAFDNPIPITIHDLSFMPYILENELFKITNTIAEQINTKYENTHYDNPPIIFRCIKWFLYLFE